MNRALSLVLWLSFLLWGSAPCGRLAAQDFDSGFAAWKQQYQLPAGKDEPGHSATADGIPNLVKYAMGLDPNLALDRLPTRVTTTKVDGNPRLVWKTPRSPSASGVEWIFEVSTDLKTWTVAEGDFAFTDEPGYARFVETGAGAERARFFRMRLGIQSALVLGSASPTVVQTVPAGGGTVEVLDPEHPLTGIRIDIPAAAYPAEQSIRMTSRPIEKHAWGALVNPITPLIEIDNGGAVADQYLTVSIPIQLPENHFAMAFIYDRARNRLEGVPLVRLTSSEIVVATRHFCELFISMIDSLDLPTEADGGFRPGVDDWEFVNEGSYIAPGGHCAGQCFSAMWYYTERRLQNATNLYNLYDNLPYWWKTPTLNRDNTLGYKLASRVQADLSDVWTNMVNEFWSNFDPPAELTYRAFLYSMSVTREPQMVWIWRTYQDGGYTRTGGHAMVVYYVTNHTLYIADPNYPGNRERYAEYQPDTQSFKPYTSGPNAADLGHEYPRINYIAKSTSVSWEQIGRRWREFDAGTIAADDFPKYLVSIYDKASGALVGSIDPQLGVYSELQLTNTAVRIRVANTDGTLSSLKAAWVIESNGTEVGTTTDADGKPQYTYDPEVSLAAGTNAFAVAAYGRTNQLLKWIGFNWIWLVRPGGDPLDFDSYVWPGDWSLLTRIDDSDGGFHYTYPDGSMGGPYRFSIAGVGYIKGYYLEGKRVGPCLSYYPGGQLMEAAYFENDEYHGPRKSYFENGQIKDEMTYDHGQAVGVWFTYRADGSVENQMAYERPDYGRATTYRPNGSKESQGYYLEVDHEWKQVGVWTYYDETGAVTGTKDFGGG